MVKTSLILNWIWIGFLVLMGLLVYFCLPGFRFTGVVLLGLAAAALCFLLIRLLKSHCLQLSKVLFTIIVSVLILGILAAVITGIPIVQAARSTPGDCRYVIVLGAGVNGTTPSLSLRNRLDAAYTYLTEHPQAICIVSGGQGNGEDISEALCMYQDLTAKGIDPERIWMEDKSTSTRENIAFSLDLIEAKTGSRPTSAGILSSEYHMFRAGLVAKEQNLNAIGIPAKTSWVSLRINYFLREIAAVWYYFIIGG